MSDKPTPPPAGDQAPATTDKPRTTIFDAMTAGERALFPDGNPTVTICGQPFNVVTYVGDGDGGAAIVHRELTHLTGREVIDRLFYTAAHTAVTMIDWSKGTEDDLFNVALDDCLRRVAHAFCHCHAAHMRALASRGKPS